MKLFIVIAVVIALFACNNQANHSSNEKHNNAVSNSCFMYALNKDSIILKLQDSSSILKGELQYLPYEKDGTIGNLYDMKWFGDTLFGLYKSYQEGEETISEIALLKKANTYLLTNEIWGSANYKFDSSNTHGKFIDKNKIAFDGDTLTAVNCK